MSAEAELIRLQREFVTLIECHRPSTWPPDVFRVVNAAIRLQYGSEQPVAPNGKPRLSVVPGDAS